MLDEPDTLAVQAYFSALQERLTSALENLDGEGRFHEDLWERPTGGGGRTRVLEDGALFERAGINLSSVRGSALPATATAARPELAGRGFQASGVSLVLHPRNPYLPSTHLNVRFFVAESPRGHPLWWFGGGFDLTPYYGFVEDAIHWHRNARAACTGFGASLLPGYQRPLVGPGSDPDAALYTALKTACDQYFVLPHRGEARGIGGLFFDDLNEPGFGPSFGFTRNLADHFLTGYAPIVERRRDLPWGERERAFQLMRRGRYAEFNLVLDRGTLFGLQSGGRTESILMSMPPMVSWCYDWTPKPGSPEARLTDYFLVPKNWLAEELTAG